MKGDQAKWEKTSKKNRLWNSEKARHIQKIESKVIIKYLESLNLPKYNILEIGCGNGYVGSLICQYFYEKNIDFTYHFTDLLEECVEKTKETLQEFPAKEKITINKLDVLKTGEVLGENSQEIIISTGFASAATYKEAVPIVASCLKKDGILIADFVNNLSPIFFLRHPLKSLSRIFRIKKDANNPDSKYYNFGKLGLRDFFAKHNLKLLKIKAVQLSRNPLIGMFKKS